MTCSMILYRYLYIFIHIMGWLNQTTYPLAHILNFCAIKSTHSFSNTQCCFNHFCTLNCREVLLGMFFITEILYLFTNDWLSPKSLYPPPQIWLTIILFDYCKHHLLFSFILHISCELLI